MGINFTEEQRKVIDTRSRNLLVSAAAGSGKTAVLVERIIQMVTDDDMPLDIERLLVVTFTNAAAAEMREKIADALEKKLEENPMQKHIHRQLVLLSNANIMTIHAFCLKVIKNHFNEIQLDPGFRIGDQNELVLLKGDVLKDLLEEKYEEGSEDFLSFVESFSGSKSDAPLEELILNIYRFSVSNPWPKLWLQQQIDHLKIYKKEELEESVYYKRLVTLSEEAVQTAKTLLMGAKEIALMEEGPVHYLESVQEYLDQVDRLTEIVGKGYQEMKDGLDQFPSIRLSSKRKGFDPLLKERAKSFIDTAKAQILSLREAYFRYDLEEVLGDIEGSAHHVTQIVNLTQEFLERYQAAKEDRNLIDFNDIEHFALTILQKEEIAKGYRDQFEEILIDEYQDSNLVQETILNLVSRVSQKEPNIFMVGDVKQSIYKFRLAKPELFLDKFNSYSKEDSKYQRIDLHKNFRSRKEVIETVNYFFRQTMSISLGDVAYDEASQLYIGASYEAFEMSDYNTEILLIHEDEMQADEEQDIESSWEVDVDIRESEARAIAKKIDRLVNGDQKTLIYDKKTGGYRNVKYSDIVILLRTTAGWINGIMDALNQLHIPSYSGTKTGYFDTIEIKTMMNLLRLIDNTHQDIPLVAILRSPIVGLKGEDLAKIRIHYRGEMIEAVRRYIDGCLEEDELKEKLERFLEDLSYFRDLSKYMQMDELIYAIYDRTNYDHYVAALPGGAQRTANLNMFADKASSFDKSSYLGVFNFIRYVENIQKYDIDQGEATILAEHDNLVKIMSIHKSKGLEYPIVFVAGLGKMFNKQDLRQAVVCHPDLGIGSDYINYQDRYRVSTLSKNIIKEQIMQELLSEELRILYVAMTRAKEKLILVGSFKDIDKKIEKWAECLYNGKEKLSRLYLNSCTTFLDWIMGAFIRHPDAKNLRERLGYGEFSEALTGDFHFEVNLINGSTLQDPALEAENQKELNIKDLLHSWKRDQKPELFSKVDKILSWQYPYQSVVNTPVQLSVSDIKKEKQGEGEEDFYLGRRPKFIEEKTGFTAAERGTIYHKVMNYLDPLSQPSQEAIDDYLQGLRKKGILDDNELRAVSVKLIIEFLKSSLCERMRNNLGTLRREIPFVIGVPAYEIGKENISDLFMVQGVIDAFFEEDDHLVLVDYKTDLIHSGEEDLLMKRYEDQLNYYKRALEQITGKKVKESVLFALSISKEIKRMHN